MNKSYRALQLFNDDYLDYIKSISPSPEEIVDYLENFRQLVIELEHQRFTNSADTKPSSQIN